VTASVRSVLIGTSDELCERLLERREKWGFTNIVVPGEAMETFALVVARLAGTKLRSLPEGKLPAGIRLLPPAR
jgi:hypothetical protein